MLANPPAAHLPSVAPDHERRGLPVALIVSTLCHAAIGFALALWLVPGQRASLGKDESPLSVTLRKEAPAPPVPATPGTEAVPPSEASADASVRPTVTEVAQARVEPATTGAPVQSVRGPTNDVRSEVPAHASARAAPTAAMGATTLAIDATVPANTVLASIAGRGLGVDFPVEVGKLVSVRSVPAIVYPPAALEQRREASVLALVVVDEQGMPYDISLLQFDKEFVEAAQDAIKATRFAPAEDMEGRPIMFFTTLRINFLASTPGSMAAPDALPKPSTEAAAQAR